MSVHESLQRMGAVRAVGIDTRQRGRAQHSPRRLDLPEQLLSLRVSPIVEVFDIDDVQATPGGSAVIRLNGTYRRQPVANTNRLTDFGDLRSAAGCHVCDQSRSYEPNLGPCRQSQCLAPWRFLITDQPT